VSGPHLQAVEAFDSFSLEGMGADPVHGVGGKGNRFAPTQENHRAFQGTGRPDVEATGFRLWY
jgi:hypothetical protein